MVGILGFCLKFQVIPNLDSFYIWSTLSKYERIYRLRKNSCNIIEKYKKSVTYREGRREIPSRVVLLGPEAVSSCWRCIRPWSSRRYLIRRPPWLFPLSHVSISIPWNFSLFLSFFFLQNSLPVFVETNDHGRGYVGHSLYCLKWSLKKIMHREG